MPLPLLLLPAQVPAELERGLLRRRLLPFCMVSGTPGLVALLVLVRTVVVLELA